MKRLLLLLPLLLPQAAQAMDYVKCEAMQMAYGRASNALNSESYENARAVRKQHQTQFCGGPQKSICNKCDDGRKVVEDYERFLSDYNKATAVYTKRMEKIQADYEAEGCY